MAIYEILFERQPERLLRRLPRDLATRVDRAILALAEEPQPSGCRRLRGYHNLYRIRVGDWRISYAIEDDQLVVLIIEISPRGDAYRNL